MGLEIEPRDGGFGLYVHWPFCMAKCPYCDFNSHVSARIDQRRWVSAFEREIARVGADTHDRVLNSVFFGGGTPSLMEGATVAAIMDSVRRTWRVANDMEVTLEANPTSVEAARFAAYREAGVNRLSLGVQALNDADLRRLGRLHSVQDAVSAFKVARAHFDRVSFDLIYARQGQTIDQWCTELHRALDMTIDHISLYQLTVEPGTAFADRSARGGLSGLPDEDLAADLYEMTLDLCSAAGFDAYEVSNLARDGAICRHNMIYWSEGDWIGIGPGAHGRQNRGAHRYATEAPAQPGAWLASVHAGTSESRSVLSAEDRAAEFVMMGLRTTQGISRRQLQRIIGTQLDHRLSELEADGLLIVNPNRIIATTYGRFVLDAVVRELLI